MPNEVCFKRIGIAGLGLIGGSFAKSFNSLGITVYGYDQNNMTLAKAAESDIFAGLTDEFDVFLSFPLDLIYICLPVKTSLKFIQTLGDENIKIYVTDAGSVKSTVVDAAITAGLNFCGGHPIKGKETSGFENSEQGLFKNAKHVLTPLNICDEGLPDKLKKLHVALGMEVVFMNPSEHDNVFSLISHLPHLVAFCLMDTVSEKYNSAFSFAGGGFMDFTRIAASDPVMWADIFYDNKEYILRSISDLEKTIKKWKTFVETDNYLELKESIDFVANLRRHL